MHLLKILKVIVADFKTVQKKFEQQGIEKDTVKKYLDLFKSLRDGHKLKPNEKDIETWGKKQFEEFQSFLDDKAEEKKHVRKLKEIEGATLVTENEDWLVYNITSYEAAKKYGDETHWCITQEHHWKSLSQRNNFYYIISKNLDSQSPWFKIAVQVERNGKIVFWDASDKSYTLADVKSEKLNIPKFEMKPKDSSSLSDIEVLFEDILADYVAQEEYYSSLEAYENEVDSITELDEGWKDELTESTEKLVRKLYSQYGLDFDDESETDEVCNILLACSVAKLFGDDPNSASFSANNEIASMDMDGDEEPEVRDDLTEEFSQLSEEERDDLLGLVRMNGVYVNDELTYYNISAEERIVLVLDNTKLRSRIKVETEKSKISKEKNLKKVYETALKSKNKEIVLKALERLDNKKILMQFSSSKLDWEIREVAIEKLGELYGKQADVQEFLKKKVADRNASDDGLSALKFIKDQKFLKSLVVTPSTEERVFQQAIYNITDQKFLFNLFFKLTEVIDDDFDVDDADHSDAILDTVNQDTLETIYNKLTVKQHRIFDNEIVKAAKKESLLKKLALNAIKKKEPTTLADILIKIPNKKWVIDLLKKLKPRFRNEVINWPDDPIAEEWKKVFKKGKRR